MPQLVTFDVYSALVDVESSLLPAVCDICSGSAEPIALIRTWRAKQLEGAQLSNSLQRERIPFRELTRRALVYTFERAGQTLLPTQIDTLVAEWDKLQPWPEAEHTLANLKARGHQLGVLSNGDEQMLRALLQCFGVRFDHIFASDHAGVYKPHPAIYALPAVKRGIKPDQMLHVAGAVNDVLGAKMAGLRCAWSNRTSDRMIDPDVKADYEMHDLSDLLDVL